MKHQEVPTNNHPDPLGRNRSILLARDLLEVNDWVTFSCKQSKLKSTRSLPGDASELISIAVVAPDGRLLLDVLVRPDGAVNSDLLKLHGCDPAHAFNAPLFQDVHKVLTAGFAKTRVLTYDCAASKDILSRLCRQEKLPQLKPNFIDVQMVYTRFLGTDAYKALPAEVDSTNPGILPINECMYLISLVKEIAASSQINDSATAFNKNWSAAFYKPKSGPAEKLKELLGLND